jgi:molybdenum cofactor synthesis domain-containing protein
VGQASGCVTAEAVIAGEAVPPFANSAMDGYAVQAADTSGAPVQLEVVGSLAAGAAPTVAVGRGQAVRIMTGAPVPPGADAVVPVEVTVEVTATGAKAVSVQRPAVAGDHVRDAGEDVAAGQEVFPAGTVLTPGHVGVLASIGATAVRAFPSPRVGVLSTGDELVDGGGALGPGQIRDSNRPTLLAMCRQSGFDAVDLGLVADDPDAISVAIDAAVGRCDALVTSGGVSVGDFDHVKVVLDELSKGRMRWMQVAVRPAKPLAFGVVGTMPVFGLPGNPVSSMVSFELFARPALRKMAGHAQLDRARLRAVADEPLPRRVDGKLHLVRVVAAAGGDGRFHVRSSGKQASNLLRSMALANALALLPDGPGVEAGDDVEVVLLG